jgi:hypothetical protein
MPVLQTLHRMGLAMRKPDPMLRLLQAYLRSTPYTTLPGVLLLLDQFHQDPLEPDADGRTVFERPPPQCIRNLVGVTALLVDALWYDPLRWMAVAMAGHSRLGAESPLAQLLPEVVRHCLLPLVTPYDAVAKQPTVEATRRLVVASLRRTEGLAILPSTSDAYAQALTTYTPADFRREHVVLKAKPLGILRHMPPEARGRHPNTLARLLHERWDDAGLDFHDPLTSAYVGRAVAAAKVPSSKPLVELAILRPWIVYPEFVSPPQTKKARRASLASAGEESI